MLRLAHRILSTPTHTMPAITMMQSICGDRVDFAQKVDLQKIMIERSTIVIADNVSEYWAMHDKMEWDLTKDIPSPVPFCDPLFIEWKHPENLRTESGIVPEKAGLTGVLIAKAGSFGPHTRAVGTPPEGTHESFICHWWSGQNAITVNNFVDMVFHIDAAGKCLKYDLQTFRCDLTPDKVQVAACVLTNAFLCLSFANCKNVKRVESTDADGPSEKWLRRQKQPKLRYHVLDINPMKEVLRTEGGVATNGLQKALHICRGHFATYTEEKPLFGRTTGTFWIPQHVRGKAENGIVIKDYKVNVT